MAHRATMRRRSPAWYSPESNYVDSTIACIILDRKYIKELQGFALLTYNRKCFQVGDSGCSSSRPKKSDLWAHLLDELSFVGAIHTRAFATSSDILQS